MTSVIKNYIMKGIICALALMSLLTLCFTLLKYDIGFGNPVVESGFTMLSFESKFIHPSHWGAVVLGVFSILELILAIALIGLAIWNFLPNNKFGFISTMVIIGAGLISILYMIEGLVFKSMVLDDYNLSQDYLTTACFVPLILVAVLVGGYFALDKLLKVNDVYVTSGASSVNKTQPVNFNRELNTAESLKKYKELLDAGVITQEEFDEKKKQILGF